MHYALNPRTFLYSHYCYTGLRVGCGVVGIMLAMLAITDVEHASAASLGALCVSLLEVPAPLRHKVADMSGALLLCTAITLIVTLVAGHPWLLKGLIILVSFFASMLVVYGRKTMPLQFAALFSMTLALEHNFDTSAALTHAGMFAAGGSIYLIYSSLIAFVLRERIQQQILAETLFEFARYIDLKAGCYDVSNNLDEQLLKVIAQHSVLTEKLQTARDILLRRKLEVGDTRLIRIQFDLIDCYELALSTQADYEALRHQFIDTPILPQLEASIVACAREVEAMAYALTRNIPVTRSDAWPQLRSRLEQLQSEVPLQGRGDADNEGRLRGAINKILAVAAAIEAMQIHASSETVDAGELPRGDVRPFLTRYQFPLSELWRNLRWTSSTFRFSCRVATGVMLALFASEHLPYASHGYWIILTVVIILKPTFSATRQRTVDRIAGTIIGCALTAILLHYFHQRAALLAFLFIATCAVPAFVYLRYRYTAIAASMQILLQISLVLNLSTSTISERILDTLIGAAIATASSFVLPFWERGHLPALVAAVLKNQRLFLHEARQLLGQSLPDDFPYRLARKRFMDSTATLAAALSRMPDEPIAVQRAIGDVGQFLVQNQLVLAHVAALRFLFRLHAKGMPPEVLPTVIDTMFKSFDEYLIELEQRFAEALNINPASELAKATSVQAEWPNVTPTPALSVWSGWSPLARRIESLTKDARKIGVHTTAIAHALSAA